MEVSGLDIPGYKLHPLKGDRKGIWSINPVHPGEFILATYMEPFGLSCRYLVEKLDVSPSTLNRILRCQSGISPESWLAMQDAYDLWHAGKKLSLDKVQKVQLTAA